MSTISKLFLIIFCTNNSIDIAFRCHELIVNCWTQFWKKMFEKFSSAYFPIYNLEYHFIYIHVIVVIA